jgi:dolichol-phosphate mannosyltransferase
VTGDDLGLSVVIPVRDEVDSLLPLHRELDAALTSVAGGIELVFVDDGSRDGSLARLREIAEKDARVRVIALEGSHGQSAALEAGFRAARGAVVATLDADLQNDPADLPRMLAALEHADVVSGVRIERHDSWPRRTASRIGNRIRNWVTGETVSDVGCSLRVMRSSYLQRVKLYRGMHRFLPTLLRLEGARLSEVPVAHRPRRFGRSKVHSLARALPGLADCLAVRWMKRRAHHYRVRDGKAGSGPSPG